MTAITLTGKTPTRSANMAAPIDISPAAWISPVSTGARRGSG
ncbi:MAG: hypothetical protein ACLUI3_08315 [Christensenellales bacterium]